MNKEDVEMVRAVDNGLSTDGDISTGFASHPIIAKGFHNAAIGCNSFNPQKKLVSFIKGALADINLEIDNKKNPPIEYFKPNVVLSKLSERLCSEYRSALKTRVITGQYSLYAQLLSLEIEAISLCVSKGCIVGAKNVLNQIEEKNCTGGVLSAASANFSPV